MVARGVLDVWPIGSQILNEMRQRDLVPRSHQTPLLRVPMRVPCQVHNWIEEVLCYLRAAMLALVSGDGGEYYLSPSTNPLTHVCYRLLTSADIC